MTDNSAKQDKKILREAITIGERNEKTLALNTVSQFVEGWKKGNMDHISAYSELFSMVHKFDQTITRRYDGITAGQYVNLVAQLFSLGYVKEEDLDGLSENVLNRILLFKQLTDKH